MRWLSHFEKNLDELRQQRKQLGGCGAGTGRVAVTPDGRIYPCSRFIGSDRGRGTCPIGHVEEGFYKSKLAEALRAGEWARLKCRKCPLAERCAGGCPAVNLEATGSLYEPPEVHCAEMRAWANTISKLPTAVVPKKAEAASPCPGEG